MRVPNQELI